MTRNIFSFISKRVKAYIETFFREGPGGFIKRLINVAKRVVYRISHGKPKEYKDFLIISGCFLDAPHRYRAEHQKEQLEKYGLCGDVIYFNAVTEELSLFYDAFIFYRVPITPTIKSIIQSAKEQNKMCIFDIDDLVFDEKYVKDRFELKEMSDDEREVYIDGVRRHKETLKLCDFAVGSTEIIAKELKPYVKEAMVNRNSLSDYFIEVHERAFKKVVKKEKSEVIIGYFSGSKTHEHDFAIVKEVLSDILKKFNNVKLLLTGYLDVPPELKEFKGRIIIKPFVKWQKFPEFIAECDINIVPSEDTLFNNAKSEIKFLEAALVHKPTIASGREAFKFSIKHGKTGFLADTKKEWVKYLELLIQNRDLRVKVGEEAYEFVKHNYSTKAVGRNLNNFIEKNRATKVIYYFPSVALGGGLLVAYEHLTRLQKRGFNVSVINMGREQSIDWFQDKSIPILVARRQKVYPRLDNLVATMWSTVERIKNLKAGKKFYLVQGKEYLFEAEAGREDEVKSSYSENLHFITVSKWCQRWLRDEFGKQATLAPNGLNSSLFYKCKDKKIHDPIRILIEGDPESEHKNIDEAFEIVDRLDFGSEVWFISYAGKPKSWYKVDKVFNKILYERMREIYCNCDILLKTSKLESFSYPPLEMMACGGLCIVAENEGNREYIENESNALTYQLGDIDGAILQINRLLGNAKLQNKLIAGGLATAKSRGWERTIDILEDLYRKVRIVKL